jgi:hypothetical protein
VLTEKKGKGGERLMPEVLISIDPSKGALYSPATSKERDADQLVFI